MDERCQEKTIPILWSGWDEVDTMHVSFTGVEFTSDWGPFSSGDKFVALSIDFQTGKIEAWSSDDKEQTVEFKLVPRHDNPIGRGA